MRRNLLEPPRMRSAEALYAEVEVWPRGSVDGNPVAHEGQPSAAPMPLGRPVRAIERRRPLFHPRTGWVRRMERALNQRLARSVWPWVPAIHMPYGRQLRTSLTLSEADIVVRRLPVGLDGLRILLISDPHAGPFVSPEALARVFARLMAVAPDVIVLAGDLTTSRLREWTTHREAFCLLRAPLGVFAVLGNHDHYTEDPAGLRAMVERDGIRVLHNASTAIGRGGVSLSLAGVDDLLRGAPDLDAALAGASDPVVLVSHNPDLLFDAARRGVAVVLSGHTHAGQMRIPGLGVLVRQSRYRLDEGRYRAAGTDLVVSRGLGVVGLPLRLFCPPEAVLVRLRAPALLPAPS